MANSIKSDKSSKENPQKTEDNQYPWIDDKTKTTYLNDSTQIVDGVSTIDNESGSKIIFPNGKVIYNYIDLPILRDFPKQHITYYKSSQSKNYGLYDLSKISVEKKNLLFANMDGFSPKKVREIKQAHFMCRIYGLESRSERIYRVLDMEIYEERKQSEDDIMMPVIGRIGFMEVYDKKGNKLREVKLDKYGGEQLRYTPDKKYIVLNSNGHDDSDTYMVNKGIITIWDYENLILLDSILHFPGYFTNNGIGCTNNYIGLTSRIPNCDSLFNIDVILDKKLVSTLTYSNTLDYDVIFNAKDGGKYQFKDGSKYENGSKGFKQYSLKDWNKVIDSIRNKIQIEK